MIRDSQLDAIHQENGLLFGLKWSLVGCVAATSLLAGCSLFDSGTVRYNTVVGDKRVPQLNPGGSGYQATQMAQQQALVMGVQQPPMATSADAMMIENQAAGYFAESEAAMQPPAPPPATMNQPPMAAPVAAAPMVAPAAPAFVTEPDGTPILPPTMAAPPTMPSGGNDPALAAEINALERDLAATQARRQQVAQQQQDDGWLPDMGIADWFGSDKTAAAPSAPMPSMGAPSAPAMAASGMAAPVMLPPPPAAPGAVPMPPVISEPPSSAPQMMSSAPAPSALDVPLAPSIGSTSPVSIPASLIPPSDRAAGAGYLQDSRYAGRGQAVRSGY